MSVTEHRPFTVINRVVKDKKLTGVIAEDVDKKLVRFKVKDLIAKMLNNYDFNIRVADNPLAKLTVVEELKNNACMFYFKTLGDKSKKNNFNSLPALKDNSTVRQIKLYS